MVQVSVRKSERGGKHSLSPFGKASLLLNVLFALALTSLLWDGMLFVGTGKGNRADAVKCKSPSTSPASDNVVSVNDTRSSLSIDEIANIKRRLSCLDPRGPQPTILLTLGRSGSSSIWYMMGNMTGMETEALELPGKDEKEIDAFLFQHDKEDGFPGQWLVDRLCKMQKEHSQAGVVGFKWKPYSPIYRYQSAQAALKLIAAGSKLYPDNPPIKIVRSRRNLLDVYISKQKHRNDSKGDVEKVPSHCAAGDDECLDKAFKASTAMKLNTLGMMDWLQQKTKEEDDIDQMLFNMDVPHLQVQYERLYFNYYAAEEWQRIFSFLGKGPVSNLTLHKLEKAMKIVPTHASPTQKVTLFNFEEVANLLEGTPFEHFLH